jgi:glutathione S-transferase
MTKITLKYFPIGGRAEPIRLAAAVGKVPFTNEVFSFPEFGEIKSTLPFGQLPVLEIESGDGKKTVITQSSAILRYIGKMGGTYPSDALEALQVDEILGIMDDLIETLVITVGGAVRNGLSEKEWSGEEKIAIRQKWMKDSMPKFLDHLEDKLKESTSGWLVGDSITIADLRVEGNLDWINSGMLDGIPKNVLDKYPLLKGHMNKVREHEQVKAWYANYIKPYSTFDFEP